MSETLITLAIADYIIDALSDAESLGTIRLFIRGGMPLPIPKDRHPFIEVMVGEEAEGDEMTGNSYSQTYTGLITVSTLMAPVAGGDYLEVVDRKAMVPSYDQVNKLVAGIKRELQRDEHRDMGNLTVVGERVIRFSLAGPLAYGMDRDERSDNYTNFGSIPFEVETEREG